MADDRCIHHIFDRQAAATPDAVAVIDGERHVTYAELQHRAHELAAMLRTAGVGPEVAVPLVVDRSADAVIATLGVLEAGGAYVPINPRDPLDRIAAIVEDAAPPVAVVQSQFRDRVRAVAVDILDITEIPPGIGSHHDVLSDAAMGPDNLATIVYTSGTTGTPKGVEIPHRCLMSRLRNGYGPRRHDLQKAPLGVVAHFSDLWVPLLSGGPVIFAPDAIFTSGRALLDVVRQYGTSRMVFVPSQLSALLDAGGDAVTALGQLDSVLVSGEPLTQTLVATFKRLLPHVALLNAYGASEIAGLGCMGEVASPADITVGTPLRGCTVDVLDDHLNPVPPDEVGEVYLGGPQVARGYRNLPSQTTERFLPDSVRGDGHRMYRTGDVGQQTADGRIRILGRRDLEVKVHGYRVNLHEVEAVLERVPGVQRGVVTMNTTKTGDQLLIAHAVVRSTCCADSASIRDAIAEQLPAYMVPQHVRLVNDLPLLPNGKIDRAVLATDPIKTAFEVHADHVAPRSITERTIAHIWQELLDVQEISVTDDFFALGGDSLGAQRFILRAEDSGLTVTLEQLEEAPSLAALAIAIERGPNRTLDGREPAQ